jgi:hypothetical protein
VTIEIGDVADDVVDVLAKKKISFRKKYKPVVRLRIGFRIHSPPGGYGFFRA